MDSINISYEFIDKYVRFTKPEYLQVYIYIKYAVQCSGEVPGSEELARALDISPAKAEFILEYWARQGELEITDKGYILTCGEVKKTEKEMSKTQWIKHIKSSKPAYSQEEINQVEKSNKQVAALFYQAETILNKVLSPSDTEMLFSFHDWLGLPVEVIMMLLSYAAKRGKTTKHYLETVAIDWADKGIDTYEAAEEYVSELEAADSAESAIKSILGIYNRALSSTERKYIKKWVATPELNVDLISLAYDKTIEHTGKLSCGYMNKILESWVESGYSTVDEVKTADEEFYKNNIKTDNKEKCRTKSKFNNYEDENKTDYTELEAQILDMMLDDIG